MNDEKKEMGEDSGNNLASGEKPPKTYKSKIFDPDHPNKWKKKRSRELDCVPLEQYISDLVKKGLINIEYLMDNGSPSVSLDASKIVVTKGLPDISVQRRESFLLNGSIRDLEKIWIAMHGGNKPPVAITHEPKTEGVE